MFFDLLEINWRYEVQGYEFNGYAYLPDFYLTDFDMHVEVRGSVDALQNDLLRLESFAIERNHLLILQDIPDNHPAAPVPLHPMLLRRNAELVHALGFFAYDGEKWFPSFVIAEPNTGWAQRQLHLGGVVVHPTVRDAYDTARTCRFEFGETPEPPQRKEDS